MIKKPEWDLIYNHEKDLDCVIFDQALFPLFLFHRASKSLDRIWFLHGRRTKKKKRSDHFDVGSSRENIKLFILPISMVIIPSRIDLLLWPRDSRAEVGGSRVARRLIATIVLFFFPHFSPVLAGSRSRRDGNARRTAKYDWKRAFSEITKSRESRK